MKAKSSAHYQREYRRRLREAGLVKKEVWILPEHAKTLQEIEQALRITGDFSYPKGDRNMVSESKMWTTRSLYEALSNESVFLENQATIELIEGVQPSLLIVMKEYGDLPIFMTVSGEQIIAEAVLWSVDDVVDQDKFNRAVLKTHKYFPLSTISLEWVKGQPDHYHMFGALSSASILQSVLFEIEMLAANVIQATEAYAEFLKFPVELEA